VSGKQVGLTHGGIHAAVHNLVAVEGIACAIIAEEVSVVSVHVGISDQRMVFEGEEMIEDPVIISPFLVNPVWMSQTFL
jgi:hypothetical protein